MKNETAAADTRAPFTAGNYPSDQPLSVHPFRAWLIRQDAEAFHPDQPAESEKFCYIERGVAWLESLGFDKEKHKLEGNALDCARYIMESYAREYKTQFFKFRFSELFTPATTETKPEKVFQIRGGDYTPTPQLERLSDNHGGIMPLENGNYYAKESHISEGGTRLHLNYQSITGGRTLCTLTD